MVADSSERIVECNCSSVKAKISDFKKSTPGRLICYCDDCQNFLKKIKRNDLLDECGGTEIIPVYPSKFKFLKGKENLKCLKHTSKGLFRWYTSCCNTPFGNTRPGFPWLGLLDTVFKNEDLQKELGPIRSRVCGKYATCKPPKGTPDNMKLKDIFVVGPFLLKGFLKKEAYPCELFKNKKPIVDPKIG
ncbi:MAG: DUF6151 family protein [Bacteriovoracaceae bacterium]|jgi:hypothetical protein|nr:DUF6151 family protein [Bacteriovoracaceae bacterium]